MDSVAWIAPLLVFSKCLLIFTAVLFLISGIDDLFIDLCFVGRSLYRRLFILPRYPRPNAQTLLQAPEQRIAIMIPAWDESAVIRPMLEHTLSQLNYSNYHVFVGTYPNDEATGIEVEKVRERFPQVHRIILPHAGPSNKADCLNWVYQGILLFEQEQECRFDIFVMQDCEDVIDPLCPKLINYLIPRADMVQLPVMSLEPRWWQFTAGHYIDEFAQLHYKDMVVRELLNKNLPAAGVGCAFSRRSFERVAAANQGQLFSVDSLTEDYDFGIRLKDFDLRAIFVKFMVERREIRPNIWTGKPESVVRLNPVCIREHFPATLRTAVRQKSRWVVGITLQGWEHLGWLSGLATRYMLFRDRKALISNFVNILGYLTVLVVLSVWALQAFSSDGYRYPPLVEQGSWVWYVILCNALLLVLRILFRGFCVYRLYGWSQALLSLPRAFWANIINFLATCRAIGLYWRYWRTGKIIAWDKTSHSFPSTQELQAMRRRIGDLLLDRRLVTVQQLDEALQRQQRNAQPLGQVLLDMGVIKQAELEQALEAQ